MAEKGNNGETWSWNYGVIPCTIRTVLQWNRHVGISVIRLTRSLVLPPLRSVMEVSEQGVRGSAATHASVERVGAFGQEFFEADHPFIFLVWDYYSGMLLLMGRVVHPLDLGSAAGD